MSHGSKDLFYITTNAILFLYEQVLNLDVFKEIDALRAIRPERLPVVLSVQEVFDIIDVMQGRAAYYSDFVRFRAAGH